MSVSFERVVNNTYVGFSASLSLFTVNGVAITDFSVFADALNPKLVLVDSNNKYSLFTASLDFTVNFRFTCTAIVLDGGGVNGLGKVWTKQGNIWLPNVWHYCFQAAKGSTGSQYTTEMEVFGVDPRPIDVATLAV